MAVQKVCRRLALPIRCLCPIAERLRDFLYGTPLRLFERYASGGATKVTLRGKIQGAPWEQTVQLKLPQDDKGSSEIERMWAYRSVSRLMAEGRAGKRMNTDEVVRLCEGYSFGSLPIRYAIRSSQRVRGIGWLIPMIALVGKLLYEAVSGTTLFVNATEFQPLVEAHLAGAVMGMFAFGFLTMNDCCMIHSERLCHQPS